MQFCNQNIPKTIIARSFTLGQLIEDNKCITWCKFKNKNVIFLQVIALCSFPVIAQCKFR